MWHSVQHGGTKQKGRLRSWLVHTISYLCTWQKGRTSNLIWVKTEPKLKLPGEKPRFYTMEPCRGPVWARIIRKEFQTHGKQPRIARIKVLNLTRLD